MVLLSPTVGFQGVRRALAISPSDLPLQKLHPEDPRLRVERSRAILDALAAERAAAALQGKEFRVYTSDESTFHVRLDYFGVFIGYNAKEIYRIPYLTCSN